MKTRTRLRTALPALAGALLVLAPAGVGVPAAFAAASPSAEAPSSSSVEDVADSGGELGALSQDTAPAKSSNGRGGEKRTGPPEHASGQDSGEAKAEGSENPDRFERGAARQDEPGDEKKEPGSPSVGNGPPDHVRGAAVRSETGGHKRRPDGGSGSDADSGGSNKPPADAGGSGRDTGGPDRPSPSKRSDSSPDAGGSKPPSHVDEPGSSRDTDRPAPSPDTGKGQRPPDTGGSQPQTPPTPPVIDEPRSPEPPKADDDHPRADDDGSAVAPPPRTDRGASDDEQGAVAPRDTNTRARTAPSDSSLSTATRERDVSAEIADHRAQARSAAGVADRKAAIESAAELKATDSNFAFEIARRSADTVWRGLRQAARSVPQIDPLLPPRQFALTWLVLALVGGFLALQRLRPQTAPPMSLAGDRRRDGRGGVHVRHRL